MGGSAVVPSDDVLDAVAAVVWAGYGGEEAGTALADVLFGASNPGGRLPFTFYHSVQDLPPYYNMSMVGAPHGRTYRYYTGPEPVFRFGEGLSYSKITTFNVSAAIESKQAFTVTSSTENFKPCDSVILTATLHNDGPFDADEITQAYVRLTNLSLPLITPIHALAAFARTAVPTGSNVALRVVLPPRAFAVVDGVAARWMLAPAAVGIYLGSQQPREEDWTGPQAFQLQLSGSPLPLSQCTDQT